MSYRDAGVDIDAGNQLVERIKSCAGRTFRPGVLGGLGGFGALFELPVEHFRQPVLVSSTDGVGTKLKLALELGKHDTIGIDLVAMCANDIVVTGAEPLFFLDYYATGRLEVNAAAAIMEGIARGCELAGTALVGGETAEMPGLYSHGDYDLAGFCVGVVEKNQIIDGSRVNIGDVLIGLAASGPHANGYSLIRKILQDTGVKLSESFDKVTLGEILLTPTRIYVKSVLKLVKRIEIHALAHITGGGLLENLPRVLPPDTCAVVDVGSWQRPVIFNWLQERGKVKDTEMLRTFNCGVGMVVCVAPQALETSLHVLSELGEKAWPMGVVAKGSGKPQVKIQV